MSEKRDLVRIKQLVLDELKAASAAMDVVCWDKACKYAMEITVPLAEEAPSGREELLALARRQDIKQMVIEALEAASDVDVVCWDKACKYAMTLNLDTSMSVRRPGSKESD